MVGRERERALSAAVVARVRTRGRAAGAGAVIAAIVLLVVSVAVAVTLGPADVSLVNVRDILANHLGLADIPVRAAKDAIVWEERLPRALVAACAGAGLALCGVVMQSLLRNPLAEPFVLGVSSGASTGAVVIGVLGLGGGVLGLSGGAFVGAVVAFGLVLLLSRFTSAGTAGVVLAGVAGTQFFSAITSLVVFAAADSDETRGVMFWLLGSLEGMRWDKVALCTAVVAVGGAVCLLSARALDAFAFGDEVAGSLGIPVARLRGGLLVVTALMTAALVSAVGAVGFVGLVVPHAVRLVVGPRHSRVVPLSALVGAVFMVWVDAATRTLFAPTPLPVGVGTALVGVPVFVALLVRRRARG